MAFRTRGSDLGQIIKSVYGLCGHAEELAVD